jgi:hypothetical protein
VNLRHSDACNAIRLAVSKLGGVSVPYSVGVFRPMDSERAIRIGTPGVSDILACINGKFYGIEVKVNRDKQRPEQASFQAAIEKAGGVYVLARFTDKDDGVEILKGSVRS